MPMQPVMVAPMSRAHRRRRRNWLPMVIILILLAVLFLKFTGRI
jgi:predicted nucleic acid-binding Zn ribbon protein